MNDGGKISSYFLSLLSKVNNPEHTSQIKIVKDPDSQRVNVLLKFKTIPVTFCDKLWTIRETIEQFELKEDLLNMIIYKNHNVDHAKVSDRKLIYEFAKEMYFDEKALG